MVLRVLLNEKLVLCDTVFQGVEVMAYFNFLINFFWFIVENHSNNKTWEFSIIFLVFLDKNHEVVWMHVIFWIVIEFSHSFIQNIWRVLVCIFQKFIFSLFHEPFESKNFLNVCNHIHFPFRSLNLECLL